MVATHDCAVEIAALGRRMSETKWLLVSPPKYGVVRGVNVDTLYREVVVMLAVPLPEDDSAYVDEYVDGCRGLDWLEMGGSGSIVS
jgi:hypothetical protein